MKLQLFVQVLFYIQELNYCVKATQPFFERQPVAGWLPAWLYNITLTFIYMLVRGPLVDLE